MRCPLTAVGDGGAMPAATEEVAVRMGHESHRHRAWASGARAGAGADPCKGPGPELLASDQGRVDPDGPLRENGPQATGVPGSDNTGHQALSLSFNPSVPMSCTAVVPALA